jgi:hypothetical protein
MLPDAIAIVGTSQRQRVADVEVDLKLFESQPPMSGDTASSRLGPSSHPSFCSSIYLRRLINTSTKLANQIPQSTCKILRPNFITAPMHFYVGQHIYSCDHSR